MNWSDAKSFEAEGEAALITPYVHWWQEVENPDLGMPEDKALFTTKKLRLSRLHRHFTDRDKPPAYEVPVPKLAANPIDEPVMDRADDLPGIHDAAKRIKSEKTVLVGVIDTGIPVSHTRTRYRNGETRILYSWQQSARFITDEKDRQFNSGLPFGQELFAKDINALLAKHSGGDLTNPLDEEAFNRDAHLVEPDHLLGHRDLDRVASHGAHILDFCAGYDPLTSKQELLEQFQVIAVNLPPQYVHGSAGNFLSFFAALAVERLFQVAEALWKAKYGEKKGGFPLVVNFSFGQRAGAKAGDSSWEQAIRRMFEERQGDPQTPDDGAPTYLVMPAGNNNLARCNARMRMQNEYLEGICDENECKAGNCEDHRTLRVPWRIQPLDQTSNSIEIWAKVRGPKKAEKDEGKKSFPEAGPQEFTLWVSPPGTPNQKQNPKLFQVPVLQPGEFSDLGKIARVYCHQPIGTSRAHFVICVAPTQRIAGLGAEAPAGLWNVAVRLNGDHEMHIVTCAIQTDQSGLAFASEGRPSYFDHPNYEVFGNRSELLDSYTNPGRDANGNNENWRTYGPVQRKGTNNSLATFNSDQLLIIGGYQISDGVPAVFSATFDGNQDRPGVKEKPTATLPSHDTPAHFGLMSAGAKDGSIAYLQGTSMSSALAARMLSQKLAEGHFANPRDPSQVQDWIGDITLKNKNLIGLPDINGLKQGWGPAAPPDVDRLIARLGND